MIALITHANDYRRIDRWRHARQQANQPFVLATYRKAYGHLELDMPHAVLLSDEEQQMIRALLEEHDKGAAIRRGVTPVYGYATRIPIAVLPFVVQRIEQIVLGACARARGAK